MIDMDPRVRHLAVALALTAMAVASPSEANAPSQGEELFKQRCSICHVTSAKTPSSLAPNLAGVSGRKAGSLRDFSYSPAMAAATLTWDKVTLNIFLISPGSLVPGTRMPVSIPDAAERAALVSYLLTLKGK
jgi:cytochrome c